MPNMFAGPPSLGGGGQQPRGTGGPPGGMSGGMPLPEAGGGGMDIGSMMNDPKFQQIFQQLMQSQQQGGPAPGGAGGGGGMLAQTMGGQDEGPAALAKQLPQLKAIQEKMKIQDAERKLKKLELDAMVKKAEQAFEQQQVASASASV